MRPAFSDEASTRSTRQPAGLSGGAPEVRLPVGDCRTLERARVPTNRTAKARAIPDARRSFMFSLLLGESRPERRRQTPPKLRGKGLIQYACGWRGRST